MIMMTYNNKYIFKAYYITIIYGYPAYNILTTKKSKLWIIYFLILGFFSILEKRFLFIFHFLINDVTLYILRVIKILFFLWLYHPKFLGALLLESLYGKIIDNIFSSLNPLLGRHLAQLGFNNNAALISDIKYNSYSYSDNETNPLLNKDINEENNDFAHKIHIMPIYKQLNNGLTMPYIGLGSSRINNISDVIYNSIKDGLRLIDTAFYYGNEEQIGNEIKRALDDGLCKREDLFIIGKIWITDRNDPEKAIKETLKKLKLNYLDMYLDHWPSCNDYTFPESPVKQVSIYDFWPKMEKLVEKGLAKSIGCSNYNVQSLLNILSFCKIKPVANEVEYHPYYNQENLRDFCHKENIALIAYYPLAKGNGAKKYIREHNDEMDLFKEKIIENLVNKYSKTPGQIILNWHLSQGIIAIPGTSNPQRMKENLEALDFKMSEEDVKSLNIFGKKMKFCGCERFFGINIMA